METAQNECRRTVVQLVANPAAGRRSTAKAARLAAAFERAGVALIRTECGPGRNVAVDPRAGHVCVVGGDGTARHAVIGARGSGRSLRLSLYPAGTINLIHRETPCDIDPDSYVRRVLNGHAPRRHYAVAIDDSLFLACASVGPDSAAVAGVSAKLKRRIGRMAYAVALVKLLFRWPRYRIVLRHDDRAIDCEAFYVAKGRYFAGPWSFAPNARIDDPLLHVLALTRASRWRLARFAWALATHGRIERVPGAVAFSCTELRAECAEPAPVQADGDLATTLPVTIRLVAEPFLFI